jgi:hypothetical protein
MGIYSSSEKRLSCSARRKPDQTPVEEKLQKSGVNFNPLTDRVGSR